MRARYDLLKRSSGSLEFAPYRVSAREDPAKQGLHVLVRQRLVIGDRRDNGSGSPSLLLWVGILILLMTQHGYAQTPARKLQACLSLLATYEVNPSFLPAQFRVLSWNIEKGKDPQWVEDLRRLPSPLDLILLQEAYQPSVFGDLIMPGVFESFAEGYQAPDRQTGVLSVARAKSDLHCALSVQEPWLGTPKATSINRYQLAGSEARLLVINLHSINFEWGLESFGDQLNAVGRLLEAHAGPAILAGDLNTWSDARLERVTAITEKNGLEPLTFVPDRRTTALGLPLDHIFIRGLHSVETGSQQVTTSDHNPIWGVLRVIGKGELNGILEN